MSNIIDASDQFRPRRDGERASPLDRLRGAAKVPLEDRPRLAKALGDLAVRINPDAPHRPARRWFDELWSGDRWAKRKRYIRFPDEPISEHSGPGEFVAAGTDFAALIEHAAKSLHPGSSGAEKSDRERLCRDILRGTSFLPALQPLPVGALSSRRLLTDFAAAVSQKIDEETDLTRLWSVLEEVPIRVLSYALREPDEDDHPDLEWFGDEYGRGPLGEVSKLAAGPARAHFAQSDYRSFRFRVGANNLPSWHFPFLRLGLRGRRIENRLFQIPERAFEVRAESSGDGDGCVYHEDQAYQWLLSEGIISGELDELPEIKYDDEAGFGWRRWVYDTPGFVELQVRPKADGSPGIWVTSGWDDSGACYPVLEGFDALKIEAECHYRDFRCFEFLGLHPDLGDSYYRYSHVRWPSDEKFNVNGTPPAGAASGFIESNWADFLEPDGPEGWLDDEENLELQDLLFGDPINYRFCPSFAVDDSLPAPFARRSIAASIFTNLACEPTERIANQLLEQARIISDAGLTFHAALIAEYKRRLDRLFD